MNGNAWSWLSRWCRGRGAAKRPASRRPGARFRRLWLEELECRRLLSATNLFGSAIPLALNLGQSQAGVIGQTPSYYAFSVTDAGRLTAEVAATGGATRLTLLTADGQVLMQSDGQSAGNPNDLIDLHLTGSPSGTNYYLEVQGSGTGTGSFVLMTSYLNTNAPGAPMPAGIAPWSIATGDFNRDGNADLAVASIYTGQVSIFLGAGDGTFGPEREFAAGSGAKSIVAVDFNGDGKLDLATANFNTNTISLLLGNGDGTFQPQRQFAAGGLNPVALAVGDFNGDAKPDLAVAEFGSNTVAVLTNNGDGTFATAASFAVGSMPYDIVAGDFNGDGKLDLAVANSGSDTVSILLGNGNATFAPGTTVTVGQGPRALVARDFNGDGVLDLATANFGSADVSILLGRGDGTFTPKATLAAGVAPTTIVAADFNGDGHVDLATGNLGDGTISIFLGRPDGTFVSQGTLAVGAAPSALVAADFNHDGTIDLAFPDQTSNAAHLILGKGDGTFQTQPLQSRMEQVSQVVRADFNGDGVLDLATLDSTTNDVTILLGQGDGTFRFGGRYSVGAGSYALAVGDFNGDHIADLVTGNFNTANISVLLGHGDGTFGAPTFFAAGFIPIAVVVGDFNNDGRLDVVTSDYGSGQVSILFGNGNGTFAPPVNYAVGALPEGITAADFNHDGHLDLAVANYGDNTVSILLNNGDGTFAPQVRLNTGRNPYGVSTGDFNGDGNTDLAVANSGSASVSIFLGDGLGGFSSEGTVSTGAGLERVLVGDFNHDGKLDLATIDTYTNQVTIHLGAGDGTFRQVQQIPVGQVPLSGVLGDFNGDGNLDLVTADSQASDLSILLGRGDGTFQQPLHVAVSGGPVAIATADFNGDGLPDMVTVNPTTGVVAVSLGNGDGTFQAPLNVSLGGDPVAVTVGDFNHDGRPDIAIADYLTNSVSILLGIGDGTFGSPRSLAVGSRPDAVVTGDFNGDGILDLAVANFGSGTVSILLGRADGSFAAAQQIAVGIGPVALAVGDINGDGTTELIVANSLSRTLSILEAAGDGTFRLVSTVALGIVPSSVVTGDFNGDGKLDIAVTDQAGNAVYVLLGNGDDTFQTPVRFATGTGPTTLVTGDFNGDGHLDLATANNGSNDVTVLLGRGDGTFQAQAPFSVGPYPFGLVASDFNNDGRLDLATANGLGEAVSVGLGFGDGTFGPPGPAFSPVQSRPIVADFNGDGVNDVVVLRGDGKILFRAGLPAGGFDAPIVINPDPTWAARDLTIGSSPGLNYLVATDARTGSVAFYAYLGGQFRQVLTASVPGTLPAHFLYSDLNGDGLLDGIIYLGDTGQIVVYLQHPNDDLSDRPPDYVIQVGRGVSSMTLTDVNGDGRPDILVTDQSSGEVHVFLNSATAPFSSELSFRAGYGPAGVVQFDGSPQVQSTETPVAMVVGLFDGDAIPDLAVLDRGTNRVDILIGDGRGGVFNPSPATSLLTGLDPVAIVTADFNGDGIPDLAVLNKGSNDISIFLGNGHGGFTEQVAMGPDGQKIRLGAGNAPTGLTVADINGDGKLDLLVGDARGDVLTLLGNGDGTFRPYQRIDQHMGLAVSDQNTDGVPEFAFANQSLDQVTYLAAQSTTTFQQGRQNGVVAPDSLQFADLNGDGIPDLIVTNSGGNDILVYLGQGNDQFGTAHRFFTGTDPAGVTVGDLNGDGIPDLAVANEGSNDVSIWLGQGQGAGWTMTAGPRLDAGTGPVSTVVRDVNGDGIPDILVANSGSNNVYQLNGVGRGFFDDQHPVIYQTGSDPEQLFVGHFGDGPGLDLVSVNAGSNDLTFFAGFGPGRSLSLGGVDPVAAIAGDFNLDGTSDLIVAHRDGTFALLLGGSGGPQVASLLDSPGLTNVSDLAFGQVTQTGVDFYATVAGRAEAIPLAFVLETNLGSPPNTVDGPTSAQVVNRQVTEFTSATGSAELEVIATLTLVFDDSTLTPTSQTIAGGRIIPAVWETADTDHIEAAVAEEMIARGDGPEEFERNASISGAAETPLQEFLKNSKPPAIRVPFSSPLEVFDGSDPTPLDTDEGELASAGGRPDSVVGAAVTRPVSVTAERIHPFAADSLDQPSSPPTLRAPLGRPNTGDAAPAADELEDRSGSWLLGLRRLSSLALSLLGGSFVRERPPPEERDPSSSKE